jgi:hypothetical protein
MHWHSRGVKPDAAAGNGARSGLPTEETVNPNNRQQILAVDREGRAAHASGISFGA